MRLVVSTFLCVLVSFGQSTNYSDLLAKARAGNGQAAYQLGKIYEYPKSRASPPDLKGAAYWYTQASKAGVPEATVDLARFYLTGLGVPRDDSMALQLYESAAKSSYPPAMTRLAEVMSAMNYHGNGEYFGRPWLDKAAELGEPDALNDLGWLALRSPTGTAPTVLWAIPYFEKAINAGSCPALFNLGAIYFEGSIDFKLAQNAAKAQSYFARVHVQTHHLP